MPRIFTEEPNKLTLHDNLSDSDIVFYYRTPTSAEIAAYTNGQTKRAKNRIISCVGENRQKWGLDIMTGFREGDFLVPKPGVSGEYIPISSDPGSPNYTSEWKQQIKKYAADLVAEVAVHVFEGTSEIASADDGSDTETGGSEDPNA